MSEAEKETTDGLSEKPMRLLALEASGAFLLLFGALGAIWWNSRQGPAPGAIDPRQKPGWTLTFADEFDGDQLDRSRWIDSYPDDKRTHANNEQQYYAADGPVVRNGFLRLTADKRSMGGMPYTSAMVCSYGQFSQAYGWFEIRARFPIGKGMWPAFWLLPESKAWPPEIDVLEILGDDPRTILMTNHWGDDYRSHQYETSKWTGPDSSAEFHTFAVDWQPDSIVWYVDGVPRHRTEAHIAREPMFVLANLAVGGDLPGPPDETTPFPGTMEVDYIRVYARTGANTAP